MVHLAPSKKRKIQILKDVSGIVKPSRYFYEVLLDLLFFLSFFSFFFNPFAQIWKWIFQGNSYWVHGQDSLTDFSCLEYGEIAFFGFIASFVFVAIVLILIFWDELLTDMAIPGWPYFWVLQVQEKQPCCTHLPGNSTRIWRFVSHSIAFICVTICIILCV